MTHYQIRPPPFGPEVSTLLDCSICGKPTLQHYDVVKAGSTPEGATEIAALGGRPLLDLCLPCAQVYKAQRELTRTILADHHRRVFGVAR